MNEFSDQLRQFVFDFEGFSKNLNATTILELDKINLPQQKIYTMPELELQAKELWQDYSPEIEEIFWELYNELLGQVKQEGELL